MKTKYDIIIVGGGLVGCGVLHALQGLGLRIAMLEKNVQKLQASLSSKQLATDSRPISLSYSSYRILSTLNIWPALAENASPIKQVHVSQQGRLGRTLISADECGVDALGYVVPFSRLQRGLVQGVFEFTDVDCMQSDNIVSIDHGAYGVDVTYEAEQEQHTLHATLLIVADGTASHCRDLLRIDTTVEDNDEVAMAALLQLSREHNNAAYERFTKNGTVAALPMFDNTQYRVVWTMKREHADYLQQLDECQLLNEIKTVFAGRIDAVESLNVGGWFPLKTVLAQRQVAESSVLIGNAAHTIYPIAAQGFNLGLRDVAVLADVLEAALRNGQLINNDAVLRAYTDWREQDQRKTIGLTRSLSTIFDCQLPLFDHVRGLGLLSLDLLSPLKKRFAQQAMGMSGKLPRLLRGISLVEEVA